MRTGETLPAGLVAGKTFTGHDRLRAPWSGRACYPCAWAMGGRPPHALRLWTVAAAPGEDLGPSHPKSVLAVPGKHAELLLTARNDMRAVGRLLARPPDGPWCAAVAESGQKHSLPYTAVNRGRGPWRVQMDALTVTATPAEFAMLLFRAASLRGAGFTSAEIEAADPGGRLTARNLAAWREHGVPLEPWRRSPQLHLACFMISKEHVDEYRDYFAA